MYLLQTISRPSGQSSVGQSASNSWGSFMVGICAMPASTSQLKPRPSHTSVQLWPSSPANQPDCSGGMGGGAGGAGGDGGDDGGVGNSQ